MCLTTCFKGGTIHALSGEAYVLCNAFILWYKFCNLPAPSPAPCLQVNSPLAGADLWDVQRELHLPHSQPLTHTSLSWHLQHTFSQSNAADYFWVPVLHFKGRQRGRSWGTQSLHLVPIASSAHLCTPTTWRGHRDMSLFQLTSGRHLLQL